ncbi:hypothetical protein OC861_005132 [Tilletia horrida]|nr:hypothetical protein OC845_003416 [Tilletia horrida]KAK0562820.1 hypothetical protein OC861_005132 [Tilletia horrida]
MGVRGLASFCAGIEPHISEKVELNTSPDLAQHLTDSSGTAFVIDALAFLFSSFHSRFGDSLYGGEYAAFSQHVLDCVHAWRAVGLRPIFVFDGKGPDSKLDTISSRITAKAAHLALYMRSPADSRTSIRWQVSCNFLPPLQIDALLDTLHRAGVQTVMALEEADAIVASLAGSLGGYSVSRDSDMFVLNPPGTSYKGYVPIESIAYVWQDPPSQNTLNEQSAEPARAEQAVPEPEEDDGFTAVVTSRKGRKGRTVPQPPTRPFSAVQVAQKSIPASSPTDVQLHPPPTSPQSSGGPRLHSITFSAYKPAKLAEYLELPVTLLPILGSLLGNDHSHAAHFQILFEQSRSSGLNAVQRVNLCAQVLKEEVGRAASPASATTPRRGKSALSSLASSRTPSAPGSPNPWRKPAQRLGTGKGTSTASPKTPPTPSVSGTGSSGLESSFVSIRSIGSAITSTGLATPRLGATTGGAGDWASSTGGDDDDDGASLISDMPNDPVWNLIEAVVRRIVLGPRAPAAASASGTALPMGRDRRAGLVSQAPGEGTPQWEAVINAIVEGVRSYALLVQQAPDDIADPDTSRFTSHLSLSRSGHLDDDEGVDVLLLDEHDPDSTRAARLEVMQKYAKAFKETYFFDGLATMMTFRFYIPRLSLEDPDQTSTSVNTPRQIRRWVYAILFGAFGFHWSRESLDSEQTKLANEESEEEDPSPVVGARPVRGGLTSSWIIPNAKDVDGDPDELVLVQTPPSVSSYGEGSLLGNSDEDDDGSVASAANSAHRAKPPMIEEEKEKAAPVVLEMVRKGDRCAEEEVPIPSLSYLFEWWKKRYAPIPAELQPFATSSEPVMEGQRPHLPNVQLALASEAVRQTAYLYILYSDNPLTRALEPALQPLAACLRFMMKSETDRWGFSAPRRIMRREELEAAIYAGCVGITEWQSRWNAKEGDRAKASMETNAWAYPSTSSAARTNPPPTARAIHLSTSLQATLDAAHVLSQVLLLYPSPYPPPYALHEGPLFHAHLSSSLHDTTNSSSALPPLWKDADLERKMAAVLEAVLEGVTLIGKDVDQERREKRKQLRTVNPAEGEQKPKAKQQGSSGRKGPAGSSAAPSNLYAMLQIE